MQDDSNNDVNLLELADIIWDKKWLVAAITGAFIIFSSAHALMLPPSFEGKIDIAALDQTQMTAYSSLNDTPGISQAIYSDNNLIGQKGIIFGDHLFEAFVAQIRNGKFFAEAHIEIDPEIINFNGTEIEKREILSSLRENYRVSSVDSDSLTSTLRFSSGDKKLSGEIVARAFNLINEEIRRDYLRSIDNLKRSLESTQAYEIGQVETAIANAISNYDIETAARLANLTEHAAIARQLGVANNQAGLPERGTNGIGINVNTDLPLYLRGFKALEKEIELISARGEGSKVLPYVPNYPQLSAKLRELKTDRRSEHIEKNILLTPLANAGSFTAIEYELGSMTFEPVTSRLRFVIMATLTGGIIAIVFVILRHSVAQRKQAA